MGLMKKIASRAIPDQYLNKSASSYLVAKIKTLLNSKANVTHNHSINDITNLQNTLDSKANASHTHSEYATKTQVGNLNYKALSQSEYDALSIKDANTIYFIYEDEA